MTGQDAVRSAQAFNEALGAGRRHHERVDGDARAVRCFRQAGHGSAIKFIGTGEQTGSARAISPGRDWQPYLGLGDILAWSDVARQ